VVKKVPGAAMPSKTYAFVHANIIPMDREQILWDQTVLIENGAITAIGPADQIGLPVTVIRIDATDQFLIPALVDMHIHLEGLAWNLMFPPEAQFSTADLNFKEILAPYLAHGITTLQVMSALAEHITLREQINAGEVCSPRLILNRMVDGLGESWPPPINTQVATPAEARQVVLDSQAAGYDGIKAYTFLDQDCYDTILSTAQEVGLPVRGHIPNALSVEYIVKAGQSLIAHAEEVMKQAGGDFSPEKIAFYAELIAESNTWITPTLITSRKILAIFDDADAERKRPEARNLNPMLQGIWQFLIENMYLQIPTEHREFIRRGFEDFQLPFTAALHAKGCKLMAGTDVFIPAVVPGVSLHAELQEFVDLGLSPYEALQTATTHPHEYLGELDSIGTIAPGKQAELVLLSANPLVEIGNAQNIRGVMTQSRWLDYAI
jgi:imidazolonepropionase-like amidohydrolase